MDAQQRVDRQRHLQVDGRRRQLDQHGAAEFRAHRKNNYRTEEQQHVLRVRAWEIVERQRGPRGLQNYRWRQKLEQDSEGRESLDWLLDDFHESAGLEGSFRGHVGLSAEGMDLPLWRGECYRAQRQRIFPDYGWRRDLEGTGRKERQRAPGETLGARCGDDRAVKTKCCVRDDRINA